MSHELGQNPPNDLEAQIFERVDQINAWAEARNQRGSHADTTLRKLAPRLGALTQQFRDTAAYIQTPLVLLPFEDGTEGVGMGDTTGEIVGFGYRSYPTLMPAMELGPMRTGVVAIVATGNTNTPEVTPTSWDRVIPPEARAVMGESADYTKKGVVPVIIPIVEGTHFTQIDNSVPLHFDPSHILQAESHAPRTDYRQYVDAIEYLMKGRIMASKGVDDPLMAAVFKELQALNNNSPLLGKPVTVTASYMRTPSQRTKDGYTVLSGSAAGVLRKFVYEPYHPGASHPHLKARGTVQAVIYQPEVAAAVYSGRLSPQLADKLPGTILVPLDQEHNLEAIAEDI